jgi:hypothetical protein
MPTPEEVQAMIDEALAEIDRVEAEVEELLTDLIGPHVASRVKALGKRHGHEVTAKFPKAGRAARPAASPGPSGAPPETP